MPVDPHLPRLAANPLSDALADTPVVIVHGPRQCGKTTLAMQVGKRLGFDYISLDDDAARRAAQDDPAGFVARLPNRAIIDEVQRAPEIFLPLKVEVDRRRTPGRFLLTGSTNVLLLPRMADSLAGRMGSIRLHPMAQCEIERRQPKLLGAIMRGDFKMRSSRRLGEELAVRIAGGGFPAALARKTTARRRQWYADYVDAMVQRDLRDLSRISSLHAIPKLLKLAASQTARLMNVSELAAPFQVSRPTIRDYLTLLERIFVVEELPPWHSNRLKRLVKTPKLHMSDSGLACALLGLSPTDLWNDREVLGQLLESFVFGELRRQAWRRRRGRLLPLPRQGRRRGRHRDRALRVARERRRGQGVIHGAPLRLPWPAQAARGDGQAVRVRRGAVRRRNHGRLWRRSVRRTARRTLGLIGTLVRLGAIASGTQPSRTAPRLVCTAA